MLSVGLGLNQRRVVSNVLGVLMKAFSRLESLNPLCRDPNIPSSSDGTLHCPQSNGQPTPFCRDELRHFEPNNPFSQASCYGEARPPSNSRETVFPGRIYGNLSGMRQDSA